MIPPEEASRTVEFLKALADDPETPLTDIARDFKLTTTTANRLVEEYIAKLAVASENEKEYPAKVLDYYNANLPTDVEPLNEDDIEALTPVIDHFHKRIRRKNAEQPRRQGPAQQQVLQVDSMSQNNPYMPAEYPTGPAGNAPYPGQITTEAEEEAALLKWILETTYNPRPNLIPRFIQMFKLTHNNLKSNPAILLGMLKHNFGPQAGEMAFTTWQNLRGQYVTDPSTLYQITGASVGQGGAGIPGQSNYTPGMSYAPPGTVAGNSDVMREMAEERKWDRLQKMMERKMQIDLMKTMSTINQSQTPLAANDPTKEVAHEEYDNQGRVIRREYKNKEGAGGDGFSRMYELMLKQSMDRENILLTKMEQPMKWMEPVLTSIVTGHQNATDPYAGMQRMLEIQNMLNQNRPPEGSRDKEIAKWELDTKLALAELGLKKEQIKHEWDREAAEAARAESTTDKYIESLTKTGTEILKPIVTNFASGWAARGGQIPGVGPTIPQAQPQSPEMDPNYQAAMQQQEYMRQAAIQAQRQRAVALQRQKIMEQQRKQQEQEAQMAQMSIDEQLATMNDAQVEDLVKKFESQAREFETTGSKIMKEVAKRRLVNSPQRQRDERNAYVNQQTPVYESAQPVHQSQGPIAAPVSPTARDDSPRTGAVIGGTEAMNANDRQQMYEDGQMSQSGNDTGMNFGVSVARPQAPTEVPNEPEQAPEEATQQDEEELADTEDITEEGDDGMEEEEEVPKD